LAGEELTLILGIGVTVIAALFLSMAYLWSQE
jgi:hypothetical protein